MRRAGDWLNAYGALCALIWAIGAVQLGAGAPPLNPTRERLCAEFLLPTPRAPAVLPSDIGPLAQHGLPYWGTWMPAFTPLDPALTDPYPACLRDDALLGAAEQRLAQAWGDWFLARREALLAWAFAPLAFAPLVLVAALLVARRQSAKPAPSRAAAAAAASARASMAAATPSRRPLAPNAPPLRAQLRRDSQAASP